MRPPAPARFSTITCCPSASPKAGATVRAVMSTLPAGGHGTTMRTGWLGNSCAIAAARAKAKQSPTIHRAMHSSRDFPRWYIRPVMHVVERWADWAVQWRSQSIPSQVAHHARRALIDWHAALYPGLVVAPATMLKKAFADEFERGSARTVALIN